MAKLVRREFLQRTVAGVAAAKGVWGRGHVCAQEKAGPARAIVDLARCHVNIDRRLFGSFLEHIGRAIYGGIYEPASKLSDSDGFRTDVRDELRLLNIPVVRYPGGNFVSGYQWLDGVGPKEGRPRILDRAWNSLETNQFGTNEFIAWCRMVKTEPLLAVNLGTGTAESAAALVEYCNVDKGTRWSDLRRKHGVAAPHQVKFWCLGNEMDGPWQIGHTTAEDYGRKAADASRQMRVVDRSIELIACGSTGPSLPTYLEWDRKVLEQCYNDVDAISLHRYFNNTKETDGDSARFLALNLSLERQMREVAAVCDAVRGRLRTRKQIWLALDEWNVWYRAMNIDGKRQEAPSLVEEMYNLEDALLVGGVINTLLRHADRVRVACLAQLINVIAPLLTNAEKILRQTIYYPYAWALQYAHGKVLDLAVESASYVVPDFGSVPYLDVAGSLDPQTGECSLFILNRDLGKERELTVLWRETVPTRVLQYVALTGADLKASNSFARPNCVAPQALEPPRLDSQMELKLPPRSYTLLQVGTPLR